MAAHLPPVALPTLPSACIPARLFGRLTISRTEGCVTECFVCAVCKATTAGVR